MLQNKDELWTSDDTWYFKTKDDLIYMENITKAKFLEATNDGKVILEDFGEDKAEQLWKKGEPNAEGYFTLQNSKTAKVLTFTSASGLKIKGNITLKWILT